MNFNALSPPFGARMIRKPTYSNCEEWMLRILTHLFWSRDSVTLNSHHRPFYIRNDVRLIICVYIHTHKVVHYLSHSPGIRHVRVSLYFQFSLLVNLFSCLIVKAFDWLAWRFSACHSLGFEDVVLHDVRGMSVGRRNGLFDHDWKILIFGVPL